MRMKNGESKHSLCPVGQSDTQISLEEISTQFKNFACNLPVIQDLSILSTPVILSSGHTIANRFVVQPLEGGDALKDGSPSLLTYKRYRRYAAGGSGIIWIEAIAVSHCGRGHERMLFLHENNWHSFRDLVRAIRKEAERSCSSSNPYIVLQLHHSGRNGESPVGVHNQSLHEEKVKHHDGLKIMSDFELEQIADTFVSVGKLAKEAGVDAVDVKCCHGYLLNELLGAKTRDGQYGGSYKNRTRLIMEIVQRIIHDVGIDCTVRMDTFSGDVIPYRWGIDDEGNCSLVEPVRFAIDLMNLGVELLNISIGNPFVRSYLSRPYNRDLATPEHPLISIDRLLNHARIIQNAVPQVNVVGSGFTGLSQSGPHVGAGLIKENSLTFLGFGRQSIAYPSLPADVLHTGAVSRQKCCVLCDGCIRLLSEGKASRCIVHDAKP